MRGSLPTPVRYLYANPKKYWQDLRTKYIPDEKNTTKFYFY